MIGVRARTRRPLGITPKHASRRGWAHPAMPSGAWSPSATSRYRALLAFVQREGHARVPWNQREDGLALGIWARNQRRLYRLGMLTPERASTLRRLPGWVWRLGPTFPRHQREEMLRLLRGYAKREGHARVPPKHREGRVLLGRWVVRQRKAYARGRLGAPEIRGLERIPGWSWTARPIRRLSFREMLRMLRAYTRREGHARVAQTHVEDGIPLGKWVQRKRRAHATGSIPESQVRALESLAGWRWRLQPAPRRFSLEQVLDALGRFVRREGHARVPALHREGRVPLGPWVNGQRLAYKQGRLDPAVARRLQRFAGWSWDVRRDEFERLLAVLRRYAKRAGHARVPSHHVEAGVNLGQWVAGRRWAYKRGHLSAAEAACLEAIPGWAWTVETSYPSERMLGALRAFVRREGHARVPARHREQGLPLGLWVHRQRTARRQGRLPSELAAQLQKIEGWSWSPLDDRFDGMAALLRQYVGRHRHARVPQRHIEEGRKLGKWIADRRRAYKDGQISAAQVRQLESIPGWRWRG